jgi:hypothetical protein
MPKSKTRSRARTKESFEETAKRLGCDTDKDRFEAKLGKIAKAKPKKAGK